jgi:hypothetical protein
LNCTFLYSLYFAFCQNQTGAAAFGRFKTMLYIKFRARLKISDIGHIIFYLYNKTHKSSINASITSSTEKLVLAFVSSFVA